jgi:aminoglycoside 6'-N-acetyltransferase
MSVVMSEGPVRLVGDRVTLRPVEPRDESTLREIHATPEVAAWWGEMSPDFPRDEPEAHRFAIELAGEVIGMVQFGEEEEPEFRHAWLDLFVAPSHSGRGLGTEALSLLAGTC